MPNRLSRESSPYLLQHAENPVDWYPWGPEALERARTEDRPILLSVGYSSCHWCHVMEHESFEDPGIAGLMNERYVNIKVDREERPDIDQIYMKAVQAMTGRGGWPMTVFLTPDGVPFFGGTYYPPEPRPGMPSFPQLLEAIWDAWSNRRDEVLEGSGRLLAALQATTRAGTADGTDDARAGGADTVTLDHAWRTLANQYDATHGGFGRAPKFPQPVTLEFLMRQHLRTGEPRALDMAVHTLRRMAAGGMRDHLAGGFHRYSVDARWLVPHFEKMLYDNALLARAYLDAWRLTDSDDLKEVAIETLDYLATDMRSPDGGFYSARDADSEGEEGVFYVWSLDEVNQLLPPDDARLFARAYDVTERGNFEGKNILNLPHDVSAVARAEGVGEGELDRVLTRSRATLRQHRATRPEPFRDEKIIVAWNGLAIRAFAEAGASFGRADYVAIAREAADFIWSELRRDDALLHSWMNGSPSLAGGRPIGAFLDDHASLANAFLSLHEATLEGRWLERARRLGEVILTSFRDGSDGPFYDTGDGAETLILRPRDPMDNATPSGASLAGEFFARAGRMTGNARYLETARDVVDHEADGLRSYGPAFGRMLSVLDRLEAPPVEIAIVTPDETPPRELIRVAHESMHSNLVITGRLGETPVSGPLLEGRPPVNGRATAYVCREYACQLPVTDPDGLRAQLRALASA